jgi:hypothetical protein
MNKIFEKHFQDLKFSPFVSNAFPLTKNKAPPQSILLLEFKRVLRYQVLKILLAPPLEHKEIPI